MAKLVSIQRIGLVDVYDIEVDEFHNYFANGICVHNCQRLAIEMAGFTPLEANALRKACAKKKADLMAKLKPKFIEGSIERSVKTGLMTEEQVHKTWEMIESTASYSFNKCLDANTTFVEMKNGALKKIDFIEVGDFVRAWSDKDSKNGHKSYAKVLEVHNSGIKMIYEYTFYNGNSIRCTPEHKFLCTDDKDSWKIKNVLPISEIAEKDLFVFSGDSATRIRNIKEIGYSGTRDLTIDSQEHLFYANGLVTSNSHAVAYSAITTAELWLRKNYFCEYMTALIQNQDPAKEKFGATIFDKYIKFAIENGLMIHKPHVNESRVGFRLLGQDVYFGLGHVKNVSSAAEAIVKNQPYSSFEDFYERCTTPFGTEGKMRKLNSRVVESLIYAGTFDCWGSREDIMKKFYILTDRIESNKLPKLTSDVKDYVEFFENEISLDEGLMEVIDTNLVGKLKKTKFLKDDDSLFEPMIDLNYDNSVKFIDLPVMSDKFIAGMEEEILGVSLSGNLAVKYREYTRGLDIHSLVRVRLETEKVKVKIMGKIIQVKELNFKNGNNGLRVYITDGIKDYNFLVFTTAINSFKDFYQEGDVAIIPLKNMGAGCEDPTFRFFDENSEGLVIERNGVIICQK